MDENMEWNNDEIEEELIKLTEESKMSWMMKKGWNMGKKVMITGAIISSAPIVLPPLMIFSTIGLAFSLPFGFVYGCYACTEKLMTKLLWRPEFEEQDQELVLEEEEEGHYGEDMMVMEEEEKRFIDDTKGTLETRIEFVGDGIGGGEENVGFGSEPEVRGDEEMGDSTGSGGNSFGEGEILEEVEEEEDLKRGIGEFGGDEIAADKTLEDERLVPIEVVEWNMGEIEVEDQPARGLSDVLEEIREEILIEVLEDEQKMASVIDNGEIEEDNLARERNGYVDEGRDEGNVDVRVDEVETLPLQNMEGKVREQIEVESPLEMNVENIEEGMESVGKELQVDEQNDLTEEEIQYELLEDDEKKIVSEFLNDAEAENLFSRMNEDVEENGVSVDVAMEEEGMSLLDVKEMVEEEIEGENLSEMSAEECREGLYLGEIGAKGMAEENVDEKILVKDVAGDEKPVYEMHPFGGDLSSELNFDDVAQEENYIVIEEGNGLIGADRVLEEEGRDNENVDIIVAKEEPLMTEKLVDNEKVKAISAAEGIIIKSGDGQVVDENKEEEMPVEEADGIRFAEETPVTREMGVGNILDGGGVVDERKDEEIADSMALREMKPLRETSETRDGGEVADVSGLHLYDENDVYGDNYATEAKNVREIADESGLHLYNEYDVYGDNYASAANEVVPMRTSYNSSPFKVKLDNQSQTVNGSSVEEQSLELMAVSMVRPVSLEVEGSLKESEGVVKRSGDDENVDVHKEEELPTEEADGIQKDNSIEEETQVTRARGDGNFVDEVRDKEGKKPVKEAVGKMEVSADEQNGAKIVIPERSGVFHARKDEGISDSKALKEKKPLRETEMAAGLHSASQDAREVAEESGLHLYDKDNSYADKFASATNETLEDQVLPISTPYYTPASSAILNNQSRIVNGSLVEKQRLSKTLDEEIADSVVQPVSSEVADRGSVEVVSMKKKTILPSEQVFYSEVKIWEQIGALRKIVGYQAVMQTTCVEELKALYVFTGVEPPFAFKDPADLEEINDKLRLLMLIVGVK